MEIGLKLYKSGNWNYNDLIKDHKIKIYANIKITKLIQIDNSKHTPHWFTVNGAGHEEVQVKLLKTSEVAHEVQLSIVSPKQKVQFKLHGLH